VGGVYAAGAFEAFEAWLRSVKRLDVINLLDIAWSRGGLVKGDKIIRMLTDIVGHHRIEDLPVKFTAVAVDIKNSKEFWINKGDLFSAIRASISIPLFFTPFHYNDALLVDGGVLNPVPIVPTFGDDTDVTIAVNLDAEEETAEHVPEKAKAPQENGSRLQEAVSAIGKRLYKPLTGRRGQSGGDIFGVALQAFETMQGTIANHKLAAYPPDHLIEIPRNACKMMEFDRADELIELGYKKAEEFLAGK